MVDFMTEFRMLPVFRGDACLLRTGRGDYLFDGGMEGCALPAMLTERKVRKLRSVVCTNVCPNRLGGILDLLECNWPVGEYWLPRTIAELTDTACRFNGDLASWLEFAGNRKVKCNASPSLVVPTFSPLGRKQGWLQGSAVLLALATAICLDDPLEKLQTNAPRIQEAPGESLSFLFSRLTRAGAQRWDGAYRPIISDLSRMGKRLLDGGGTSDLGVLCGRALLAEANRLPGGEARGLRSTASALALAGLTAALLSRTPSRVRFFSERSRLISHLVPRHPVRCLNGTEASLPDNACTATTPEDILAEAKALGTHHRSLVFQYANRRCGVLFCGDSKLFFTGKNKGIRLDRPTVVVAPKQGGAPAEQAYASILSDSPEENLWVRGHVSYARKVSASFKEMSSKLCLGNCRNHAIQEILLRFSETTWAQLAGGRCVCDG